MLTVATRHHAHGRRAACGCGSESARVLVLAYGCCGSAGVPSTPHLSTHELHAMPFARMQQSEPLPRILVYSVRDTSALMNTLFTPVLAGYSLVL